MKKLFLLSFVLSLFACTTTETKTTTEDKNIAIFKENSKVVKLIFDNFVNKDFDSNDAVTSDTFKFYPARIANDTLSKSESKAGLIALRGLSNKVSYSNLMFLPAVDTVTFKADGNVRVFATWNSEGKNGAILKQKYFAIFEFNNAHKVTLCEEYQDYGGIVQTLTAAPKK